MTIQQTISTMIADARDRSLDVFFDGGRGWMAKMDTIKRRIRWLESLTELSDADVVRAFLDQPA
jgi:hypothetical protein